MHQTLTLNINNEIRTAVVRNSDTLLQLLREKFGLSGPKPGCQNGDCGACTILLDGVPVKSCLILAVEIDPHQQITTIEGLDNTPIQQAFLEKGGFQCGYCTSGFLINAHALLQQYPDAGEDQQKEWLKSNLCRCTGYEGIKNAIIKAKEIQKMS